MKQPPMAVNLRDYCANANVSAIGELELSPRIGSIGRLKVKVVEDDPRAPASPRHDRESESQGGWKSFVDRLVRDYNVEREPAEKELAGVPPHLMHDVIRLIGGGLSRAGVRNPTGVMLACCRRVFACR